MNDRPAMYWSAEKDGSARCGLCPHRCNITENSAGYCGVRHNRGGRLNASSYGLVSSVALDPIEKKPLYIFHPGKHILSIGGFGCNLRCPFCQNFEISTRTPWGNDLIDKPVHAKSAPKWYSFTASDIAELAAQTMPDGNIGVAYTYNEPLINYEFLYDCANLVRDAGLKNVIVTNGYINNEPLKDLLPLIDAMNIDLKGFTEGFYKKLGGDIEPVKEAIALSHERCHVEVTTLVIPDENENDIEELAKWLALIDRDIPLHITRFFPRHQYSDRTPTTVGTIYRLHDAAKKYLSNVFTGNI